jgi:hypothetical protein
LRRGGAHPASQPGAVYDGGGAKLAQQRVAALGGSGDPGRPVSDGKLHAHQADAAGPAADEYRVASTRTGRVQRVDRGGAGQHQCSRFRPPEAGALGEDGCGRGRDVVGVGTPVTSAPTSVTTPAHSSPSKGIEAALRRRPCGRHPHRGTRRCRAVDWVDPNRPHVDDHLVPAL